MKYSYKALIALLLGCLLLAGGLALAEEIEFDLPAPEGADEVEFELLAPENEIAAEANAAPVDAGPRYLIDETNFPDPTFRGYVAGFDGDGDGALSAEELAAVTNINLWQEENNANGVANMKGLELFPNVMYLDVEHSNLTTLDVTANTKLEVLYCSYSPITSLTIGPGHDALIDIECWETQLTTLDVSGCPGLQHLDVGITPTASLDLRNNKELRYLGIFKTALTGIDLSANAELRAIVATYSEALSTLDISANAKLDVLQIGGTAIKAVDLTANPSLAEAVKTEPLYGEGIAVFDFVETYDYGVKNRNMAQTYRLMIPEDARVTVGGTLAYKLNPIEIALDVPSTVVLYKDWTLQANAIMLPNNADTTVTWESNKPKVATVSSKGKITAKKLGTATITATTDNGLTAKVKIKVTVEPTALKLNKTGTVKLEKGKKLQLKTTLAPKASDADLIWESSKPKVATVSSKGKVTAKKVGTTTITVKTVNGLTAKVKIKVTTGPTGTRLNKDKATIYNGQTLQLKLEKSKDKIEWSSSAKKIATVDKRGKVTAKKKGTATITAKVGNKKYTCKVTVKAAFELLNSTDKHISLVTGDKAKILLSLHLKNMGKGVTYSISDKRVVKCKWFDTDHDILDITALTPGEATITFKNKLTKDTIKATVTVAAPAPTPTPQIPETGELSRFIGTSIDTFNSVIADPVPNSLFTLFHDNNGTINGMRLQSGYNKYTLLGVYPGMKYTDAHAALIGNRFRLTGGSNLDLIYTNSPTYPNMHVILIRNTSIDGGIITSVELASDQ